MTGWADHVLWWQVHPLGFTGAEPAATEAPAEPHRLRRIEGWLDHLVSIGANGLLLGPVFAAATHGYDTVDYRRIDPRLGDEEDFDHLVAACRARGVRVLLDGVFNHAGRAFPPVAEALAGGPGSPGAAWVQAVHDNDGMITADYFEGHDTLVTLDHGAHAVREFVRETMLHWLRRGADGWRLDAAYAVPPEFWAAVLPAVREEFPEAWFVGEMIHGDYAGYAAAAGIDSVTQYELWQAIWSSLDTRNLFELEWTLGRHRGLLEHLVPMMFVGNHDVTRLASRIGDGRHRGHAIALLACLPGVPSIYAGDELGLEGVKEERAGGDDAVRPRLPAERGLFANEHPEVEELHRRLFALRRRLPWLVNGVVTTSDVANEHLAVRVAERGGERRIVLALNLADESWDAALGDEVLESSAPLTGGRVPPHGWVVARG